MKCFSNPFKQFSRIHLDSFGISDAEMTKSHRPPNNYQKSKLSRIRSNSLRQNRNELTNQSAYSTDDWIVKSGCHFSCIENSMGIQIIASKSDHTTNIQLCSAEFIVSKTKTDFHHR